MTFPNTINSPTAKELSRGTIIELALNVYYNAVAITGNIEFAQGELNRLLLQVESDAERVDELSKAVIDAANTIAANITAAQTAAEHAEQAATNAAGFATTAGNEHAAAAADADRAETAAERAEQAQTNTENTVDLKIAQFATTVVPKPTDTKSYFRMPVLTQQGLIDYHPVSYSNPQDGYIAMFQTGGRLVVNTPTADNHAANKKFVNDRLTEVNAFNGAGNYPNLIAGRVTGAFEEVNSTTFAGLPNALYVVQATCDTLNITLLVSTFGNTKSAAFGRASGINGYFDAYNGNIQCVYFDGNSTSVQYGTINKVYRLG